VNGLTPGADDPGERLFWTLMRRFETLAVDRYVAHAPVLLAESKRRFVEHLAFAADEAPLAGGPLAQPTAALLARAESVDEPTTLLLHGLVLETLRQAIYRLVGGTTAGAVSDASRRLAADGLAASAAVAAAAAARIPERLGGGDELYVTFAAASHDLLGALDAFADPVDRMFGERFGLHFTDVMGEFTAELVGACTALGMQRRKVVAHLAGAAMGI
jgi:hypothetical protein